MCRVVERRLACRVASARQARQIVSAALQEWGAIPGDPASRRCDDAVLVATELVANAVKVCESELTLRVEAHRAWIEIAVEDDDPRPAVQLEVGPAAAGGRGIAIVAALSSEWGQTPFDGSHKVVWSRLNFSGESALGAGCRL